MVTLNNGSIATNIFDSISPMPNNVSGLLITFVDNQRFFVEQFTGITIGNAIEEKFQPAITDLATATTLRTLAVQDLGVKAVTIGDTTTDNANLMTAAKEFEDRGMVQIKSLSKDTIKFFKARG